MNVQFSPGMTTTADHGRDQEYTAGEWAPGGPRPVGSSRRTRPSQASRREQHHPTTGRHYVTYTSNLRALGTPSAACAEDRPPPPAGPDRRSVAATAASRIAVRAPIPALTIWTRPFRRRPA